MVGSICYGTTGATWDRGTQGSAGGGKKKKHAEVEAYESRQADQGHTVFLFVQDAFPCRDPGYDCDAYFRRASHAGRESFIFKITASGGYGPPPNMLQEQVLVQPVPGANMSAYNAAMQAYKADLRRGRQFVPVVGAVALPANLYYHRGSVYLNAAPDGFARHPAFGHL